MTVVARGNTVLDTSRAYVRAQRVGHMPGQWARGVERGMDAVVTRGRGP